MIHGGQRIEVPATGLAIGREPGNDLVVSAPLASRHHARIGAAEGGWFLADLESTNGTFLNGERLLGQARWLHSGDAICVGGETLRFVVEHKEGPDLEQIISKVPLAKRLTDR